ncbi:MAG: hypothetical protein NVS1B12_12580 [Acidimicrobiales bacterium]
MRSEAIIFVAVALFMGLIGVIYFFASYEAAGSTLLAATVGLAVIPGGYLAYHALRLHGPVPQDDPDAEIRDGQGPVGAFPESSIWPVVLAAGVALLGVGFIFGGWAAIPGGVLLTAGFFGSTLESHSPH